MDLGVEDFLNSDENSSNTRKDHWFRLLERIYSHVCSRQLSPILLQRHKKGLGAGEGGALIIR